MAREIRRVLDPNGRVGIAVWLNLDANPFYGTFFETVASVFDVPMADIATPFLFGDPQALAHLLEDAGFAHVQVENVHHNAYFQNPDQFAELMVRGASAGIPALATLDAAGQKDMFAVVNTKIAGLVQQHMENGVLTVPLSGNIAQARC